MRTSSGFYQFTEGREHLVFYFIDIRCFPDLHIGLTWKVNRLISCRARLLKTFSLIEHVFTDSYSYFYTVFKTRD